MQRKIGRRLLTAVLAMCLLLVPMTTRQAEAQFAVFDAANLGAKTYDTVKRLVEIVQRALQLLHEIQMIANQIKNLTSYDLEGLLEIGLDALSVYEHALGVLWQLLGDGDTLTIAEADLDVLFDRTFPELSTPPRNGDWFDEDRSVNEQMLRTTRQILLTSEGSVASTMNTAKHRARVVDRVMGAEGNLQAVQASTLMQQAIAEELEAAGDQRAILLNHRARAQEQFRVWVSEDGALAGDDTEFDVTGRSRRR